MCLATAYLTKEDKEPILSNIAHVRFDGKHVEMKTLFGNERVVKSRLVEVDFSTSKIKIVTEGDRYG